MYNNNKIVTLLGQEMIINFCEHRRFNGMAHFLKRAEIKVFFFKKRVTFEIINFNLNAKLRLTLYSWNTEAASMDEGCFSSNILLVLLLRPEINNTLK